MPSQPAKRPLGFQLPFPIAGLKGRNPMEALFSNTIIERRSKPRYPIMLTVRYHTVGRNRRLKGTGATLNISSGGLLVSAEQEISAGSNLEVNIEWPLLLNGNVPIRLVVHGKVVRCGGSVFAVSFTQYQFRTTGRILISTSDFDSDPTYQRAKPVASDDAQGKVV
jgi:hypothetical protein